MDTMTPLPDIMLYGNAGVLNVHEPIHAEPIHAEPPKLEDFTRLLSHYGIFQMSLGESNTNNGLGQRIERHLAPVTSFLRYHQIIFDTISNMDDVELYTGNKEIFKIIIQYLKFVLSYNNEWPDIDEDKIRQQIKRINDICFNKKTKSANKIKTKF